VDTKSKRRDLVSDLVIEFSVHATKTFGLINGLIILH
jgi:hypothetical protein